jgi:hypothetical protein
MPEFLLEVVSKRVCWNLVDVTTDYFETFESLFSTLQQIEK